MDALAIIPWKILKEKTAFSQHGNKKLNNDNYELKKRKIATTGPTLFQKLLESNTTININKKADKILFFLLQKYLYSTT